MNSPIYLDYAATTPIDPKVAAAMWPFLSQTAYMGNSASTHFYGKKAHDAIEDARQQVANLFKASPEEIIWTSGATEANNLALKGAAGLYSNKGKHIITLKTEHPSVLDCCQYLEKQGFFVTYLMPETNGLLNIEKLKAAFRPDTILVSVMHVNNETGLIQDIQAIGELTEAAGVLFHTDVAQSAGKLPLNMQTMPVDLMSLCAHKLYGPKGIGALYVRRKPRVRVGAQIHGGGQEQGMRSGTLPVHQIVGMGAAFAIAQQEMCTELQRIEQFRERFLQGLSEIKQLKIHSDAKFSYPGILNISIADFSAAQLFELLPELAFSTGSACHAKKMAPSHVLRAMGHTEESARRAIRISLGRFTTGQEIDFALQRLRRAGGQPG